MAEKKEVVIQCPCGRIIRSVDEYKVMFIKKEMLEIDILCPNDSCYLRELGFIKFRMEGDKAKFEKAVFYPPFVTWNASQLGREVAERMLKEHLRKLVMERIDWNWVAEEVKKAEKAEKEAEAGSK